MLLAARAAPSYVLAPCEYKGTRGLYGKDVFNRSSLRRRLERGGLRFSGDPFVTIEDGRVRSNRWGDFDPSFVILPDLPVDGEAVTRPRGAWLVFELSTFHLGRTDARTLAGLVTFADRTAALGAADDVAILSELDRIAR